MDITAKHPDTLTSHPICRYAPPEEIIIAGKSYVKDAKGRQVPKETVSAVDALMDDTVRKLFGFAEPLSEQMARFKSHSYADIQAFLALINEKYGAKPGGPKGNLSITSFDGCYKVQVQNADLIEFGPELHAAKQLVDECLTRWAADANKELRSIITRAFQVDREGRINRAELFMLLRAEIDDEQWLRAMDAIRDSIRVVGTKSYIRFYRRDAHDAPWQPVHLDMAAV